MKILFFIESLRSGGKERRLVELLKGLSKHEDISMELVLTKRDIHYTDIFNLDVKIHYVERKYLKKDPSCFFKFYSIARDFKPDIIHVWGNIVAIYALPATKLLNVKFINGSITYALPVKRFSKLWFTSKIAFPFSDILVANSKAGLLVHCFKQSKKHRVIYNGYDFKRNNVNQSDLRKELGIPKRTLLVGMIGSFSDAKDYKTYIDVAEKIVKKNKNVYFLCIGDGVNKIGIEDLVHKRKIKNIHFLGVRSDIENICKNLDIGVLLNNTDGHAEGLSNAIMEMMASGLPVVATDAGGTPELIQHGVDGFMVEPFAAGQIINQIEALINNEKSRKRIGIKAAEKIKERFGIKKMIDSYYCLYNEVVL
ncbi:glycosyltransferase [Desulfobacula sp.]|uniref:glycosyltransferase n=1 Tax=Desulfobacula sp. TaxID=2593537 RepID=UPI0025C6D568|nr:glycosyltransferase [Desulfobacula sp.]MBC2704230.1 glycosyltransferase [Desulfobacula sp.]